jgi:hypothetical protein
VRLDDLVQLAGALGELAGLAQPFLAQAPFAEAALAPLGEVLFGDGRAVEMGLEDFADFGLAVEPGQQSFALLAVVQAPVTDYRRRGLMLAFKVCQA